MIRRQFCRKWSCFRLLFLYKEKAPVLWRSESSVPSPSCYRQVGARRNRALCYNLPTFDCFTPRLSVYLQLREGIDESPNVYFSLINPLLGDMRGRQFCLKVYEFLRSQRGRPLWMIRWIMSSLWCLPTKRIFQVFKMVFLFFSWIILNLCSFDTVAFELQWKAPLPGKTK